MHRQARQLGQDVHLRAELGTALRGKRDQEIPPRGERGANLEWVLNSRPDRAQVHGAVLEDLLAKRTEAGIAEYFYVRTMFFW